MNLVHKCNVFLAIIAPTTVLSQADEKTASRAIMTFHILKISNADIANEVS